MGLDTVTEREFTEWSKKELERRGLKRVGSCNACGECCNHLMRLGRADNGDITILEFEKEPCEYLVNKKCSVQKIKPYNCKESPMLPEHITNPNCGYSFIKKI